MADGVEVGHGYISISASARDAVKQIDREFSTAMPGTGKKAGGALGGGLLGAAAKFAGPIAAAFVGTKLISFFGDAVSSASDLNETVSKSNVIFGANAKEIDTWANSAATNFGLTKSEAQDAAASFGDMFRQIGFTGDAAATSSKSVVQMAADLGSFNNLGTDDVLDKLSGAFRGEYDSLQQIIPNISAARVEQEALRLSGEKSAKSLTAQQKAEAVMAIVRKDGARAMGDFARTSGGLANQQKILAAQTETLKQRLGSALLPVAVQVVTFFNKSLAPNIDRIATGFEHLIGFVRNLGPKFAGLSGQAAPLASFFQTKLMPAFLGIVGAGQRLAAVVLPIIQAIAREFLSRWPAIQPVVMGIFQTIGGIVVDVMGLIQHNIAVVTAVIRVIWSKWGKQITTIVGSIFETVYKVIGGVMKIVGGIVKVITGLMTGDWRKAGEGIKQIVGGIKQIVVAVWRNIQTQVQTILGGLLSNLVGKFRNFLSWVGSSLRNGLAKIKDFILAPVRAARDALQGVLNGITGKFRAGVSAIGRAWDGLKAKAKAPISFIIHTVINGGLIKAFNKLAAILPGVGAIPNLSVPGFHDGGWTGPGAKYQPAGIVHADEFVINKGSRAKIERDAPGLLNQLNGYAGGGLVGGSGRFTGLFASRLLAAQKLLHTQFSIFQRGFRPKTSYSGTSHAGDAVDLGPVTARVVAVLRSLGIAAWRRGPAQGFSLRHIHGVPLPGSGHAGGSGIWQAQDYLRGGDGLGGRDYEKRGGTSGGLLGLLKSGFASFVDWFKNLVKDPLAKLSQIASSPFGQLAAGVPKLAAEGMINKFKTFDTGGWLDPGYTLAYNGTGKRERVQTAQQAAAGGRGQTFSGTARLIGTDLDVFVEGVLMDALAVSGRAY